MSAHFVPAASWLSGSGSATMSANTPVGPTHTSASTPVGPTHNSANTPVGPTGNSVRAAAPAEGRWPVPTPAPLPLPWEGLDPRWVYGGADTLLAQALRKTHAKIDRPRPGLVTPLDLQRAALRGEPVHGSDLWRWAPEFRISALQCELLGRFQVLGTDLWTLDLGADPTKNAPRAFKVFEIDRQRIEDAYRGPARDGQQIDKVQRAAVEREDRLPEILSQADDFWPFFESVIGLRLETAPRLSEWLSVTQASAIHLLMALKNAVAARRPVQTSSLVMPVIPTPGHGSLPSGHATISAMNAEMLRSLLYSSQDPFQLERSRALDRLARRIAFNRVVAGVHFPLDSLVGYTLGTQLARLFIALASPAADVAQLPAGLRDDSFEDPAQPGDLKDDGPLPQPQQPGPQVSPAKGLAALWSQIRDEAARLRI